MSLSTRSVRNSPMGVVSFHLDGVYVPRMPKVPSAACQWQLLRVKHQSVPPPHTPSSPSSIRLPACHSVIYFMQLNV